MRTPSQRARQAIAWLVAAAAATALAAAPAAAQSPPQPTNTISVGGEGEASGAPDVAYVTVGVQTQARTAAEATRENNERMAAVLDALRARGVRSQDLQTSGLNVTPQYERDRPGVVTGYQVMNNVTVTVNVVDQAGDLLDVALGAGANRVGGLRFGIRDVGALRAQALAEAVRSARARAEALAGEMGLRLVGVATVAEEGVVVPVPRAAAAPAGVAAAPAPPPVEAGELQVTARVRVTFVFE